MASRSMRQIVAEVFGMSQEKMEGMSTSRLDDLQVEAWAWQTVDEMLHVPIEFQGKPLLSFAYFISPMFFSLCQRE